VGGEDRGGGKIEGLGGGEEERALSGRGEEKGWSDSLGRIEHQYVGGCYKHLSTPRTFCVLPLPPQPQKKKKKQQKKKKHSGVVFPAPTVVFLLMGGA